MTTDEAVALGLIAEFQVLRNGKMTPFAYVQDVEVEDAAAPAPGRLPEPPILRGTLYADSQFECDAHALAGEKTEFAIVSLQDPKESASFTGFFLKLSPIDGRRIAFVMRQSD